MRRLGPTVLLAAALGVSPAAPADEQGIALVVTDEQGAFVPDLRRDEVRVLENGDVRELVDFARDERPLSLALVLDSSDSATELYRLHAYEDLPAFVALLPPRAQCTLWTTGDRPRRIGDLEKGAAELEKRLAQGFGTGGASTLLDALVEAGQSLAGTSGRRRAILAVSGASAGHTSWSPREVSDRVRRARARVLAVMFRQGSGGPGAPRAGLEAPRDAGSLTMVGSSDHERMLASLARATGGRFESVPAAQGVGAVLRAFAGELAGQYRLRYLSLPTKEGRRVEVRIARTGVRWHVAVDAP